VDHGLAQILGAGLAAAVATSNIVGSAIVFHNSGMVNGNIGRTLVEVAHGITSSLHNVQDQAVSNRDCGLGIVYKLALDFIPPIVKAGSIGWRKWTDLEFFPPLLAKFQYAFTFAHVAFLPYHAIVLRSKAFAQFLAAAFAHGQGSNHDNGEYGDDNDYEQEVILIHVPSRAEVGWPSDSGDGGGVVPQTVVLPVEILQTSCRDGCAIQMFDEHENPATFMLALSPVQSYIPCARLAPSHGRAA